MSRRLLPDSAQPCIWMSAGQLTYKLCDREFQCENCPLDAGLRGGSVRGFCCQSLRTPNCGTADFPADLRYTSGHAWVKQLGCGGSSRWRFGLDAFAAAIIGRCRQITWHDSRSPLARGDPVCDVDFGLGIISIGAPLACREIEVNQALLADPDRLVIEPYQEGWIATLSLSGHEGAEGFLEADAAREKANRDLQWFRRQVALRLLAESGENGYGSVGDIRRLVDLREMLAGPTYLNLLPELVH